MKKYWFKPKRYGYGMYPTTWEGYLTTLALLGVILVLSYINNFFNDQVSLQDTLYYIVELVLVIVLFIYLTKEKVEGGLKWRWGKKDL